MEKTKMVNIGELGMGYKELADLAKMLSELADKSELYGEKYDLDSLTIIYNPSFGEVHLCDAFGANTFESEEL